MLPGGYQNINVNQTTVSEHQLRYIHLFIYLMSQLFSDKRDLRDWLASKLTLLTKLTRTNIKKILVTDKVEVGNGIALLLLLKVQKYLEMTLGI